MGGCRIDKGQAFQTAGTVFAKALSLSAKLGHYESEKGVLLIIMPRK